MAGWGGIRDFHRGLWFRLWFSREDKPPCLTVRPPVLSPEVPFPAWAAIEGKGHACPGCTEHLAVTPGARRVLARSWIHAAVLLFPQVPDIMSIIHSKLEEVDEEHVRKAAQQTVYILASQHKSVVVSSLLGSSLPFDRSCPALPRWPGSRTCSRGAWASEQLSPKLQIIFWLPYPSNQTLLEFPLHARGSARPLAAGAAFRGAWWA